MDRFVITEGVVDTDGLTNTVGLMRFSGVSTGRDTGAAVITDGSYFTDDAMANRYYTDDAMANPYLYKD